MKKVWNNQGKLNNSFKEKGHGNRSDQEPNGESGWAPDVLCEDERNFRRIIKS